MGKKGNGLKTTVGVVGGCIIGAVQWPITQVMRMLLWLADRKRAFPDLFRKGVKPIVAAVVGIWLSRLGVTPTGSPPWWASSYIGFLSYPLFVTCFKAALTSGVVLIIINALLPLCTFIPHAVALRSMGLIEAGVSRSGRSNFMEVCIKRYLQFHDDSQSVRVICISGRDLFVRYSGERDCAPLRELATQGKLQVLFPVSEACMPTITERYATYSEEFKESTYPTVASLVAEIDASKQFLKKNGNGIYEHSAICMWRVVLMSQHCVVQNYFPNHKRCHSNSSPVFVFGKEPDCIFSYYDTFDRMFALLSGTGGASLPATPSGSAKANPPTA